MKQSAGSENKQVGLLQWILLINVVALGLLFCFVVFEVRSVHREIEVTRSEMFVLLREMREETYREFMSDISTSNTHTEFWAAQAEEVLARVITDSKKEITQQFYATLFEEVLPSDIIPILDALMNYDFTELAANAANVTKGVASEMNDDYPSLWSAADVVNKFGGVFDVISTIEPLSDSTSLPQNSTSMVGSFLLGLPEMLYNAVSDDKEIRQFSQDCTTLALRTLKANFQGCFPSRNRGNGIAVPECWNFNSNVHNVFQYVAEVCDSIRTSVPALKATLEPIVQDRARKSIGSSNVRIH